MRYLLLLMLIVVVSCKKAPIPEPEPTFKIPATEDLVIYELFLRSFTPEANLPAATARLQELKDLGINCIWVMPCQPIGQAKKINPLGSPYSIRNYRAIDGSYGTMEDFRAFIDAAHALGMAVILDVVANHTAWDHPWITNHPEMYTKNSAGQIVHPPGTNWQDVADLNFGYRPTRDSLIHTLMWWVDSVGVDGFRCDYADGVPADFWAEAIDSLERNSDLIMLAEGQNKSLLEAGFDIAFSWTMHNLMAEAFSGTKVASSPGNLAAAEQNSDPTDSKRLYFITNHDFISFDDPPLTVFKTYEGIRSAAVAMTYMPGVPMLYNGQEVGSMQRLNLFDDIPISWNDPQGMRGFFTQLYRLYREQEVLRRGTYTYLNISPEVISYERKIDDGILVICNVRNKDVSFPLPTGYARIGLRDLFSGDTFLQDTLLLAPYEYRVLKSL